MTYRNVIKNPIVLLIILILVLPTVFWFLAVIFLVVSSYVPKSPSFKFYHLTQLHLPKSAYDIHDFNDNNNFLGDGTREFSFRASKDDIENLLEQKPFKNTEWEKMEQINDSTGCYYSQKHGDICDGTINDFWGQKSDIKFRNDGNLVSAVKSRARNPGHFYSNYTQIIVSQDNLWVLVIEFDS